MISNELAPGIVVYKNIIPTMENIDEVIKSVELSEHTIKKADETYFRNNFEIKLEENGQLNAALTNAILVPKADYMLRFNVRAQIYQPWHLIRYTEGHMFGEHYDDMPGSNRKFGMTYYLNDDYEGGEVVFKNFKIEYKADKYDLLVFPSAFPYVHSVNKITKGTRYVGVQWLKS
jgi:predicted 2-oxoglutarate/Fe(II)-dependent dioxygenase YbiX